MGNIAKAFRTPQIWGRELEQVCGQDSLVVPGTGLEKDQLLSKALR